MSKIRVGVIGAGSWVVASHLPNLQRHAGELELVAISRQGSEPLERLRRQFGFRVASEDYRDVLDAGIDVAVVASPTALHFEHAMAALSAGAHVLCEKPFTLSASEAWQLVELAKEVERELIVSFGWNYRPMLRQAKRLADEVGIGQIEHVSIHMSSSTRELLSGGTYPQADPDTVPEVRTWNDPRLSGGGYAQGQLSHAFGMAFWLWNLRASEVFALMSAPLGGDVEQHDAMAIRYDGGAIGSVAGGSAHIGAMGDKHAVVVRAIGAHGQMHVDVERERVWLYRPDGTDIELSLDDDAGWYDCIGPIDALVAAAKGEPVDNCSPGELGARTVEAIELAYRSAAKGRLASRQELESGVAP